MDDLISRQAAIDAICKSCSLEEDYHKCDGYPETSTWCDYLVALRAVPSAQPEPTEYKSHWEVYEVADTEEEQPIAWECAECGEVVDCKSPYCPECGCRMDGE